MSFDKSGFMQAKLVARTRSVSVPSLAEWFGDGDPVWVVRGLSANEVAKVNEAESRNRRETALAEAITNGSRVEIVQELQAALGRSKDTRPDLARRLELLILGSVDPECEQDVAVRVAEKFPTQFYELTNTVLELTGRGSDVEKKQTSSGEAVKSEPA